MIGVYELKFVSSGGWLPPLLDSFSQKSLSTADASAPTQGEAVNQICHNSVKSSQLTFHQECQIHSLHLTFCQFIMSYCSSNVSNLL